MRNIVNFCRAALSLGSSKHWTETLDILTGTRKVSAQALLEYFKPLYEYLKSENGMGNNEERYVNKFVMVIHGTDPNKNTTVFSKITEVHVDTEETVESSE